MTKPTGTPPDKLAALLSRASSLPITPAMIEADVAAGAPTGPDGSLNLIHYVAWLLKHGRQDQN